MYRKFRLFLTHYEGFCYPYIGQKHNHGSERCHCRCCAGVHVTTDRHLNGVFIVEGCLQILKTYLKKQLLNYDSNVFKTQMIMSKVCTHANKNRRPLFGTS
jgi:hypothetical protein